jgi:DNA modification methylase
MSTDIRFIKGDARHLPIEDESVQCIVTSPPYWGLRKYSGEQELVWGGRDGHKHAWGGQIPPRGKSNWNTFFSEDHPNGVKSSESLHESQVTNHGAHCHCGAWRGAFGLEPTIEMYVQHSVEILREMWRVLRKDGVLFWNIGDSYHNGDKGGYRKGRLGLRSEIQRSNMAGDIPGAPNRNPQMGLKPKDLCLIPERMALAAQADGWWVRSMIIWAKPNPMPESVTDRPTDSYEYIVMLTKAERYFWNADALSMEPSESSLSRLRQPNLEIQEGSERVPGKTNGPMKACFGGRNKHAGYGNRKHSGREDEGNYIENRVNVRNVWVFSPQPYREAHFATFPEELPRRCILAATKVGDTVLDPFAGSGTVGRVAIELNRKAILNDLAYHDLSEKRTKNVQRQLI